MKVCQTSSRVFLLGLAAICLASTGCVHFFEHRNPEPITESPPIPPANKAPGELAMASLADYIIEPPDLLFIQAVKVVPKPPHKIEAFDILFVNVADPLEPIQNAFSVDNEGKIDLGATYGRIYVMNLTVDEAQAAVTKQLKQTIDNPIVSISLASSAGAQQISGEHLVGPDGQINLGSYGFVYVTGLTVTQAKEAIEKKLSERLLEPEVVVSMLAYNSKEYYVISEGAGFGENYQSFPSTGNDTVLKALVNVGGLTRVSSKKVWIARPNPASASCPLKLPVDIDAVVSMANTETNYQLFPGDRLFIAEDPYFAFDSKVAKLTQPFERLLGFTSLGVATFSRIRRFGLVNNQ